MYEWMSRIASAQAGFYEVQADYYRHREGMEDRFTEILDRLTKQDKNS